MFWTKIRMKCSSLGIASATALALTAPAPSLALGTITDFTIPGSVFTLPAAMNPAGTVIGYYAMPGSGYSCFVRTLQGQLTTFSMPSGYCLATAIGGKFIAGSDEFQNGFLRDASGNITTFTVSPDYAPLVTGVSNGGVVAGYFGQYPFVKWQSFVRTPDGKVTLLDVPNATNVQITGISGAGVAAGTWFDAQGYHHGFYRQQDGTIVTFDAPNAVSTDVNAVNPAGDMIGNFYDNTTTRGFIRKPNGSFSIFDSPADPACCLKTSTFTVPYAGGEYLYDDTQANTLAGFIYSFKSKTFTKVQMPSAFNAVDAHVLAINHGRVLGFYTDNNGAQHGFFTTP